MGSARQGWCGVSGSYSQSAMPQSNGEHGAVCRRYDRLVVWLIVNSASVFIGQFADLHSCDGQVLKVATDYLSRGPNDAVRSPARYAYEEIRH